MTCITCTSSNDLVYIDIHHSLQDGDSAVITATLRYRSGALRLLVDSRADLNLHNEVRYKVTCTIDTTLHHVHFNGHLEERIFINTQPFISQLQFMCIENTLTVIADLSYFQTTDSENYCLIQLHRRSYPKKRMVAVGL